MINKSLNKDVALLKKIASRLLKDKNSTHGLKRSARQILKELVLYKNHDDHKKDQITAKNKIHSKNIQIGGGEHLLKGFLNIDIMPPADLICDVREGLPLENCCAEFVFSEHFLEHIDYPVSVKKFIRECYRILEPKGKLIIGVPNSELMINNYIKKNNVFYNKIIKKWYSKRKCLNHFNTYIDLLNYHFRDQDDDKKYTPHMWAYDKEKITSLLKEVGFLHIKDWKFDKSIANPERQFGSIYIVANK